jgi:hypothetical protein
MMNLGWGGGGGGMGSEKGTVDRGPVTRDLQFALWTLAGLSVTSGDHGFMSVRGFY